VDARGLSDLRGMHGIARLERRRRRRAGVEHLVPAGAVIVAPRGGALERVDGAVLGGAAQSLRRALDALGEDVADALALDHEVEQLARALDVAPRQVEAELLLRDVALLDALHHPAAQPAPLVDVDARAIELGVQPAHLLRIGGADGPARARPALVLRLVDDRSLVRAAADHLHVAVVHATRVALMASMIEALAEARRLPLVRV